MDPVDDPPFPVWPVDEFGMEEINSIGFVEYDHYGGSDVVAEEISLPKPLRRRGW